MSPIGIDAERLGPWLARHVPDAEPPFVYDLIAAGGSNLTYRVTDAAGTVRVLRRPPEGTALDSAHDMSRETTVLRALGERSSVPVPDVLAATGDPAIIGAGFYVMSFMDGLILRTSADAATLWPDACVAATESLVANQVRLHELDVDAVGLGDLGRRHGYLERQLRRWHAQVDAAGVRELPLLDELQDRLLRTVPPERVAPALVHGDYRFDNTVLGPDGRIVAILDWELCTIGDPIADFVWSLQYWADPGDELTWIPDAPTLHEGFPQRADVLRLYVARTGRDMSDLGWYEAFSWWKHACIVEGVHARRLRGAAGGAEAASVGAIAERVEQLLAEASRRAADAGV